MNIDRLILSPTGRPLIKIGDQCWKQFHAGSYSVSIEWHPEGRTCEPIMVIWSKTSGRGGGAFGICLSSAAKYADPSGRPTADAFRECLRALPTLGRSTIDLEVYGLLDVVLRHIPDLINCPPMPPAARREEVGEALLEARLTDSNGKTHKEALI